MSLKKKLRTGETLACWSFSDEEGEGISLGVFTGNGKARAVVTAECAEENSTSKKLVIHEESAKEYGFTLGFSKDTAKDDSEVEEITAGLIRELLKGRNIPKFAALIEGKDDEQVLDLIDRNDYVAAKLWSVEDVKECLREKKLPAGPAHVDEVINWGIGKSLNECCEEEWECIYSAIYSCFTAGIFPTSVKINGPVDKDYMLEEVPFEFSEDIPGVVIEQVSQIPMEFEIGRYYEISAVYGHPDSNLYVTKSYIAEYLGDSCWETYKTKDCEEKEKEIVMNENKVVNAEETFCVGSEFVGMVNGCRLKVVKNAAEPARGWNTKQTHKYVHFLDKDTGRTFVTSLQNATRLLLKKVTD